MERNRKQQQAINYYKVKVKNRHDPEKKNCEHQKKNRKNYNNLCRISFFVFVIFLFIITHTLTYDTAYASKKKIVDCSRMCYYCEPMHIHSFFVRHRKRLARLFVDFVQSYQLEGHKQHESNVSMHNAHVHNIVD